MQEKNQKLGAKAGVRLSLDIRMAASEANRRCTRHTRRRQTEQQLPTSLASKIKSPRASFHGIEDMYEARFFPRHQHRRSTGDKMVRMCVVGGNRLETRNFYRRTRPVTRQGPAQYARGVRGSLNRKADLIIDFAAATLVSPRGELRSPRTNRSLLSDA